MSDESQQEKFNLSRWGNSEKPWRKTFIWTSRHKRPASWLRTWKTLNLKLKCFHIKVQFVDEINTKIKTPFKSIQYCLRGNKFIIALKYWNSIKYQPDIKTGVVESDGAAILKSLVSSPTQDWSWSRQMFVKHLWI